MKVSSRRWYYLDRKPLGAARSIIGGQVGLVGGSQFSILNFDLLVLSKGDLRIRKQCEAWIYSSRLLHFCSLDSSILCAIALHRLLIPCAYTLSLLFVSSSQVQPHHHLI